MIHWWVWIAFGAGAACTLVPVAQFVREFLAGWRAGRKWRKRE